MHASPIIKPTKDLVIGARQKDTAPAYDADTDSLEAISEAIGGLAAGGLTDKERSLLGCGVYQGFSEQFTHPGRSGTTIDSAKWTTAQGNGGSVTIRQSDVNLGGLVRVLSGNSVGGTAQISTVDKYDVSPRSRLITTVHLKFSCHITAFPATPNYMTLGFRASGNFQRAELSAHSSYGIAYHTADASAHTYVDASSDITAATWFVCEIVWSVTDVKFYIDGVLKTTVTTTLPTIPRPVMFYVYRDGGVSVTYYIDSVELWAE